MAEDITKVTDPADPRRCQFNAKNGQCWCRAMDNSIYCKIHGGISQAKAVERRELKNYRIQMANIRNRTTEMLSSTGIKSLRDEVALARYMLEATINKCETESELITYSHQISDMIAKIEKLVTSCHKLESSLGGLLDKQAVLNFSTQVVNIISEEVQDEEVINKVSERIISLMGESHDLQEGDAD